MERRFYFLAASLVAGFLCSVQSATAIEIVVPDQYKAQIEAAKAAERAERARELDEGQEANEKSQDSAGDIKIADQTAPDGPSDDAASGAQDFVMQSVVEAEDAAAAFEGTLGEDEGLVSGQVLDEESGAPVSGAAIIIEGTDVATVTGEDGRYSLGPIPAGEYTLSFVKSGYIEANVTDYQIAGGEVSVFPFALPPRPAEMSDEVYELQDFTVTAEQANELMMNLDLRMSSDSLLSALSAEDLSRYADSDVASAIKRVAGVTVQDGKFAVIRGLNERYSSSLLNGTPLPSPDPDRQSVPLDLFPADVVQNLVIKKTYSPDLPANSAGGSINIITNVFPEELEISFSAKSGFNANAMDKFLAPSQSREGIDFDNVLDINPTTKQSFGGVPEEVDNSSDVVDYEFSLEIGNTLDLFGRRVSFLTSLSRAEEFGTAEGTEQKQEALIGDIDAGELNFTGPRFDLTESKAEERWTFLLAIEAALDEEEDHVLGYTFFHTQNEEDFAGLRENGFFPGKAAPADFGTDFERRLETERRIEAETTGGGELPQGVRALVQNLQGSFPTASDLLDFYEQLSLFETIVLKTEREMMVNQLNGRHSFLNEEDDELELSWGISEAETSQEENDAFRAGGFELPEQFGGGFITGSAGTDFEALQPERSWRRIEEEQSFYRGDIRYKKTLSKNFVITPMLGFSDESTERDTEQFFTGIKLEELDGSGTVPASSIEEAIRDNLDTTPNNQFQPGAAARGERTSEAFYINGKITFFEKLDLLVGVRFEQFEMSTQTETGLGNQFFNSSILQGNGPGANPPAAAVENTKLLGINGGEPLPPGFTGLIDDDLALPAFTVTYRPDEQTRISAAYSRTNARPSFKEFTFLTVRDPVTLDLESGNPALTTSDVTSLDFRVERSFGDRGDMLALGVFRKVIEDPIERTNLSNTDIFFNNPNTATIDGVEFEFRKNLGFLGATFFDYFSVGGNFAYMDAVVDVPETFRERLIDRMGVLNPSKERRLFQQPEWIANADLRFEHPEWGTSATLSLFAQSETLDSAGGFEGRNATVDKFQSAFEELNFTLSQRINDTFSVKFTAKNITDSERGIEYDDDFDAPPERQFKVGREFSVSVTATF